MSEQFSEKKTLDFLATRPLPSGPAEPPPIARPGQTFRYVLPAAIFVVVVGTIAWVTQFMPTWRTKAETVVAPTPKSSSVIKFAITKAIWDKEDEEYALEQEKGTEGHFDFPFENVASEPGEVGLQRTSCDCTHLEVCLVSDAEWEPYRQELVKNPQTAKAGNWTWHKLASNESRGFEVPGRAKGFIRVGWHGRKDSGSRLRLSIDVWHQPGGNARYRSFENLVVPIVIAAPMMYKPARANIGNLGPRDSAVADFTLWSATRESPDFKLNDSADPLFRQEATPFTKEECADLEKQFRKGGENTRVRSAFHLKVTVHEQAAGKQLDQGPFIHTLSYLLDGDRITGPIIQGSVKGEIVVGNAEDRGKVDLKIFRGKEGATREIALWTDDKMVLQPESQSPPTLQVKLTKAEASGKRTKWRLEVTVPPGTHFGPFTEENVIILRTQSDPPRFIRIPLVGSGGS